MLTSFTEMVSPTKNPLLYEDHPIALRVPEARCKPWPRAPHCRRRFHKSFFQWYAANADQFAIELELLQRTDQSLEIGFRGITRVVTAQVGSDEINVVITWHDDCRDIIQWLDTDPKRVPGGYVCALCPEDKRPLFASREDLWRTEVFEPFLAWVNDDLAKADVISLSGTPDRSTWARLVKPKSDTEGVARE